MASFKLIHVSDLHFAVEPDYGNNYSEQRYVQLALKWKNRFQPSSFCARKAAILPKILTDNSYGVDALLITGDLATTGSHSDLESAKDWIAGSASARHILGLPGYGVQSNIAQKLANVSETLIVMPGNHDRFQGLSNTPRSPMFERVFGNNWDSDCGKSMPTSVPEIRKTIIQNENDWLVVFCADFSLRKKEDQDGILGYLGQGYAYQDTCEELKLETKRCREQYPNALIVWATHFPPKFEHKKVDSRLQLLDEDKLLSAADEVGVRVIFSGHTHIPKTYQASGSKVVVICAGTPIAFGKNEKHSFNAVTLKSNQGHLDHATIVCCNWDDQLATFKPSAGNQFSFSN